MKHAFLFGILACTLLCAVEDAQSQRRRGARPRPRTSQQPAPTPQKNAGEQPAKPAEPGAAGAPATSKTAVARRPDEGLPPGQGIVVNATLARDSFRYGDNQRYVNGPAWKVNFTIQNQTDGELELGESLIVLEKVRDTPAYIASYIARERAPDSRHLNRIKARYGLDWGYHVSADGRYSMIFPLTNPSSPYMVFGFGSSGFIFTIIENLALYASSMDTYEGLGYGRVAPRSERKIEALFPFPTQLKDEAREYVAVVLPSVRRVGGAKGAGWVTFLRFDTTSAGEKTALAPAETTVVPLRDKELREIASGAEQQLWKRTFALNLLAETAPQEAIDLLIGLLKDEAAPPRLRLTSAVNLGLLKSRAAIQPLIDVVRGGDKTQLPPQLEQKSELQPILDALRQVLNDSVRRAAIEALGEIGEPATASVVRDYLNDTDDGVALTAIGAAGKLKDAEAVPKLLSVLADKEKKKRHTTAASALAAIGNRQAVEGLTALLRDPKSELRQLAADKLGASGSAEAVPALVAVAADKKEDEKLRKEAIGSLGQLGGPDALSALRNIAENENKDLQKSALSTIANMKDAGATAALISLAEKPGYPLRSEAVDKLAEAKKVEALPVFRRLVAAKDAPGEVREKACRALGKMEDKEAVAVLVPLADDSNGDLYGCVLGALSAFGGPQAEQTIRAALKSRNSSRRGQAALLIRQKKLTDSVADLWQAYQTETDDDTGSNIVTALIELKFDDKSVVPILVGRLNPDKNKLWFSDVQLLRHLTGKDIGPKYKWADKAERDAELQKWRNSLGQPD